MEINWLATVLAFAVGMAVAMIWYGHVFLAAWSKLTGLTSEDLKKASTSNMIQLAVANGVSAIGLALAIGVASATLGDTVQIALLVGLIAALTFSATTLLQHNAFELKPAMLTVLNTSYQLVLFLAMSLVIGLL